MKNSRIPANYLLSALLITIALIAAGCAPTDPSERLKPLVDGYVRAWNTGDFTGLQDIVSSQFELRMSPRFDPIRGIDSLKSSISYWRTAYPDFQITLDEVIYTQAVVAVRWTIRGNNSGPGEHPATGKSVVVPGMSFIHFAEGKIIDEWVSANDLSWLQQLGFMQRE